MLDIHFIRKNPEIIKKDLKKRKDLEKVKWVDDLIKKDSEARKLKQKIDELRKKRNIISQEINKLKKEGKNADKEIKEAKDLPKKIDELENKTDELNKKIKFYLMRLPNILHESVPYGKDDSENKEIRKSGKKPKFSFELKPHGQIAEELGVADFKRAAKISGSGFSYLFKELALMDLALQRFAIDLMIKKNYKLVEPPLMMRREVYEGVTDLADFETMMYKVEGEDSFLIATSEHPLVGMFQNEILSEDELPIKLVGVSPCFRREIGSAGIDTKGLFRVHQFNKVEQIIICKPKDSWKFHEELIKNAEEAFKKLELPYRIVNICTGDIGIVAAKKYDLEAWMPRENKYREVVSCSNCTGYQAVRLNIKYRNKKGEKEYVHTLNSTVIATGRALKSILENYQQKDGSVKVPKALQSYMNGIKVIGGKNGRKR